MAYSTEAEIQRFFSQQGVDSFADHDQDGIRDDNVVTDCIDEGDELIKAGLQWYYDPDGAGVVASKMVNRWSMITATCLLCMRRGNNPPESLAWQYDQIHNPETGYLARIRKGTYLLPGVSRKAGSAPSWSNLTVDRRYRREQIRVQKSISSHNPTVIEQDTETFRGGFVGEE